MTGKTQSSVFAQYCRVLYRCCAVAAAIAGCLIEALFWRVARRPDRPREYAFHRWSGWFLRRFGVELVAKGTPPERGLIVSNHLSYLDVLVYSAAVPCSFVSKSEVRWWPGIGWVASLSGAIYVDRGRRRATHRLQPQIAAALARGTRLVLFPEGTSGDGSSVLPFYPSLLQAAVENHAPITAACVDYELEDGDPRLEVFYWGDMALLPHALKLFRKQGVKATVRFSTARLFTDRKQAARELWQEVSTLANSSPWAAVITK